VLRAFDANNLSTELWILKLTPLGTPWAIGLIQCSDVANGRVYMAGFPTDGVSNGTISVYGLLGDFSLSASPSSNSVVPGGSVNYTVSSTTAFSGFSAPLLEREWTADRGDGEFFNRRR